MAYSDKLAKTVLGILGGAALLAFAGKTSAGVVYNSGSPNGGGEDMSGSIQADEFTLGSTTTIETVQFWEIEFFLGGYEGSINWGIYSNNSGAPGTLIDGGTTSAVSHVYTGVSYYDIFPEFEDTFGVNVPLSAGTYWLTLHNGPANDTDGYMYWESTGNSLEPLAQGYNIGTSGPWTTETDGLAFRLYNTSVVPLPASVWSGFALMAGLGLLKFRHGLAI